MSLNRLHADVVIVGAGPTGLTLANFLGGMGVSVLLVERNLTTVQEPRAVSIDDESMRTMQAIGLHHAVGKIVASGYGSHYYSPARQRFLTVEPTSRDYGFDKRNAFQQPELEQVLRDGLSRHASVRQMFGWEFQAPVQTAGDAGGTIVNPATGERQEVSGRYLVACDGGRSPIRTALGIELKGSTFSERWLIVDLITTKNRQRHTEVFCDPARPCLALPGPGGIRRYEFMLFPGEDAHAVTDHAFVRGLLRQVGPDEGEEFRRIAVYTFHARMAERWREGRIFLAGDAAHLTPPFAGQGMNSGLRDAHNLGWKLAEAIRAEAADALLDSYQTERAPHAWEMIRLAMRMGQIMMPHSHAASWLTRNAFRMMGISPALREYFAQMKYKPKPRFRQGLIWADGRTERATLIGRLIPQPVLEAPDRARALLDDCLTDDLTVLVFDEFPDRALPQPVRDRLVAAGLRIVGLTPEWMNPASAEFPIYRDASRLFRNPQLMPYLGHALLLRRDRYVAAAVPVAAADTLIGHARHLRGGGRISHGAGRQTVEFPVDLSDQLC